MKIESRLPVKVLIAKTSLDGHIRGPIVVAQALKNAGMEVIYGGMLTPEKIVAAAIQEDVDVIGLNIGGRYGTVKRMMDTMQQKKLDNIIVIAGGPIPPEDIPFLKGLGINEVFIPGSSLESIVKFIRDTIKK